MTDLISRQAAIEAIKEDKIDLTNPNVVAVFKATGDFEKVETQVMTCDRHIKILKDLPSAQPEKRTEERTETPARDCISRQAAIRIASGYCHPANIADELAKLPPVQPERKTAHWIEGRTDDPKTHNILCSNCFEGYPSRGHANSFYTSEKFKYCPHCGAKMEKEVEE